MNESKKKSEIRGTRGGLGNTFAKGRSTQRGLRSTQGGLCSAFAAGRSTRRGLRNTQGGLWRAFGAGKAPGVVWGTPSVQERHPGWSGEHLHLVQPGIIGRCAVEMDAWVRQPSVALFGVGAKVVEDDMGFDSRSTAPVREPHQSQAPIPARTSCMRRDSLPPQFQVSSPSRSDSPHHHCRSR